VSAALIGHSVRAACFLASCEIVAVSVQVVKASGGTTAYSDKHTGAYTILQGASGNALDEVYSPEQAANGEGNNLTDSTYDMLHVRHSATLILTRTLTLTDGLVIVAASCTAPPKRTVRDVKQVQGDMGPAQL